MLPVNLAIPDPTSGLALHEANLALESLDAEARVCRALTEPGVAIIRGQFTNYFKV